MGEVKEVSEMFKGRISEIYMFYLKLLDYVYTIFILLLIIPI